MMPVSSRASTKPMQSSICTDLSLPDQRPLSANQRWKATGIGSDIETSGKTQSRRRSSAGCIQDSPQWGTCTFTDSETQSASSTDREAPIVHPTTPDIISGEVAEFGLEATQLCQCCSHQDLHPKPAVSTKSPGVIKHSERGVITSSSQGSAQEGFVR
jgi:hypothetical protein